MYRKIRWLASAAAALALAAALAAACGGGGGGSKAPAATATQAGGAAPTAATKAPGGGGAKLTLTASNILFDRTELKVAPGEVTIELDNKDAGVPHNLNVFKGKDASGESIGLTATESGPNKQALTVTLQPGDYFYQCDVHPTTMTGTIRVE